MPNDRNVAALVQALRSSPGLPTGIPLEVIAAHLAGQGVLVPSALTEDQAVKIGADAVGAFPTDPAEVALCVREGLEQIARGARYLADSGPGAAEAGELVISLATGSPPVSHP
jgi:hypothetical protein